MRKINRFLIIMLGIALICISIVACNSEKDNEKDSEKASATSLIYMNYNFNKAYINLPDGNVIYGDVEAYKRFSDGTIKVRVDGKTYYTHFCNVVLVSTD